MLPLIAAVIVAGCVAASVCRLAFAAAPTSFDAEEILAELRGDDGARIFPDVCAAIRDAGSGTWEGDLLDALVYPDDARATLLSEQLAELDWRVSRWARVPRVCASIASSSGFLLAALVIRTGLADLTSPSGAFAGDAAGGLGLAMNGVVSDALNVAAIGVAGTAICVACQLHARRVARARLAAADKLVDRFEELLPALGSRAENRDDKPAAVR